MKTSLFLSTAVFALAATASTPTWAGKYENSIRGFWADVDNGNFDQAVTFLHPDVEVYAPFSPVAINLEAYRQIGESFRMGFPDIQHQVLEVSESKTSAAARCYFSGTNTGSLMGNPATGNRVELPFLAYLTFDAAGLITRFEIRFDMANFNSQLMAGIDPNAEIEAAKKNIQAAYDALNSRDWQAFANLCDEKKFKDVGVAPEPMIGVWNAIEGYKQFFSAFPDLRIKINEIAVISPTRYLLRVNLSGTNTSILMGMPPTGKAMNYDDCDIVELDANGKIIYHQPTKGGSEVFRQLGIDPMGNQENANKNTVQQIMQTLDNRNLKGVVAACAPDCRFNGWAAEPLDANGYVAVMSDLLAAFPDSHFTVDDMIAEGDKVVVRHHFTGTHTGAAFMGTPVSNKKVSISATVTFELQDGKPIELWLNADFLGLLMQIGAVPMPK